MTRRYVRARRGSPQTAPLPSAGPGVSPAAAGKVELLPGGGGRDRQIGWTGADRTPGLTRPPPEGKSAPIKNHRMSRTSEIRQMSRSVRPSIDPAETGSSPARGAFAPAPAARRHGA
ncbi:hypothetical protein GCM10010425_09470 [Streptomyces spororaveus]|uniref:Uncharacterized protein n=1 Tax=Streptomyces spororaveus TaxID=284039 RepID=A0ABQ3TNT1_9ACTN|nr:hypothetical protein Sspor_75430 [Streptomyces spororaveus]